MGKLGERDEEIPIKICCGGKIIVQEVTDAVLEWRVSICERCSYHNMGECTSTLTNLALNIRKIGTACPIGRW